MAIQIITADQALTVNAIITYIYADPGLGKTSMGFTGDKAISFDFDKGSHRTGELRRGAVVPVQKWTDIGNLTEQDLAPYNTIVLDTVGAMLECIKSYLLSIPNNRQKDNTLKLKAQGAANVMFKNYVHMLISMGKDVVFLAHASEDQNGDQVIYRPDLGGKNRNELYRIADVMGYLTTVRTGDGKPARVINFNPSDTHHAKNAGDLGLRVKNDKGEEIQTGEVWMPDLKENPTFLADLINQAKDHINTLTPAQLAANKAIEDFNNFAQSCEEALYASDLNQLTESLDKEHTFYHNMRQSMVKRAKELGCVFDKERNAWSNPPEFNAISDAQRDELQDIISLNNLDVKEVCEYLGIDALSAIELSHFSDVKAEITRIAVEGFNTEGVTK